MKKSSITRPILKRAISTYIFYKKDPKQDKIFYGLLPLQELLPNYWKLFPNQQFLPIVFENIWIANFKKTRNFDSLSNKYRGGIGEMSLFVKPKWFHGGFFFLAETSCDLGWFQVTLEVFFFLEKVSIPKNDPILAKIHHMLGFIKATIVL